MSYVIPPDTLTVGVGNPPFDMNNAADMLGLLTRAVALHAGTAGADPAGNAANVTAVQAAVTSGALARRIMPTRLVVHGHSFANSTFGVPDQAFRMDQILQGLLGIGRESVSEYSISGGTLCADGAASAGYANFLQQETRPALGAPYAGRGGAYVFIWGINDMGKLIPSSDFGTKTVYAQVRNAFKHGLRACISRARAATVMEVGGSDTETAWAFGAGMGNNTLNSINSGTGYRTAASTVNANATFTIPADWPGGTIAMGFLGAAGAFGGTASVGGTFSGTGGANIVTSNFMNTANHAHYSRRFATVAGDASKTILLTVTAVDAGGVFALDYAQLEATVNLPLIVLCNIPRLLNAAAYASYAGSYWANAGNLGASGDTDVADFNAAISEVAAEFAASGTDPGVVVADLDTVIGKLAANYAADGIHPTPVITPACAQAIYTAISKSPAAAANLVPDNRVAMGKRTPRRSQCWSMPDVTNMVSATLTMVTGNMYLFPFVISEPAERWDGFAFEVTTASTGTGGTIRAGLYDDVNWKDYPFALLADWGTKITTGTGVQTILTPTVNQAPDSGLFWVGLNMEAQGGTIAGTLRAFTGRTLLLPDSGPGAAPVIGTFTGNTAYLVTGVAAGGLPGTFPAGASLIATAAPVTLIRRA